MASRSRFYAGAELGRKGLLGRVHPDVEAGALTEAIFCHRHGGHRRECSFRADVHHILATSSVKATVPNSTEGAPSITAIRLPDRMAMTVP